MDDSKKLSLLVLSSTHSKKNWPTFHCPSCGNYSQKLTNLNSDESQGSKSVHDAEWWEPEMIEGSYVAVSTCLTCKQKVYITGGYTIEGFGNTSDEGEPYWDYEERYSIRHMTPSVEILRLPSKCSEELKRYVESAAEVIFISPDLTANRIRASIDVLLTEQKIPRFKVHNGKRTKISTHERIKLYGKKNSEIAGLLEAVKWIGNIGSHNDSLTMNDLLEGLEIYSLALELLYNTNTAAIRKKAATINKNRGVKKLPSTS